MASQTNSPLVLVIDDNPMNIKLMRGIMAFGGYALETALSAEEGLTKARQIEADIILMDLQLPEMDGYQATEILRNSEQYKETPILAISGYAMGARETELLSAGFSGYLQKPITVQDVLAALAQHLGTEPNRLPGV
jgi:two-component system cell cycle response regulator DivK